MGAMGLLGSVMAGVGGKVVDYAMQEGRMLREERMRELDRQWRSSEAEKGRAFESEKLDKQHGYSMDERGFSAERDDKRAEMTHNFSMERDELNAGRDDSRSQREIDARREEAEASRDFQRETGVKESADGRLYRIGKDGVEYLDGAKGTDKMRLAADKAARETADSAIGKGEAGSDAGQRYQAWKIIYDQEMKRQGYGSTGLLNGDAALPPVGGKATIRTRAEYDALPKGAKYVAPDGSERIKP